MATDKQDAAKKRQPIVIGILAVIVVFILYEAYGMFGGGGGSAPATPPATTSAAITPTPAMPAGGQMPPQMQQQAAAQNQPAQPPLTPREIELMRQQEELEARYIAAVNELQMLKVQKDIAEANKAIASAKLDTVTAQKNTLNALSPQAPTTPEGYAQALAGGQPLPAAAVQTAGASAAAAQQPTYTVISITNLQYRWSAVLGYQGKLYSVSVGDVLPADNSKVTAIDKSSVTLINKDGKETKISLVPII